MARSVAKNLEPPGHSGERVLAELVVIHGSEGATRTLSSDCGNPVGLAVREIPATSTKTRFTQLRCCSGRVAGPQRGGAGDESNRP